MKRSNKLLYFFYPIRDAFGVNVGATPFRIGEIYSVIYAMIRFTRKKVFAYRDIDVRVRNILLLLVLNCFLTVAVSFGNIGTVEVDFMQKYVLRNILTIFLIGGIWGTTVCYSSKLVVWGMKWNVVLQIFMAVLFFLFSQRIFMNHFSSIWDIQTANYGAMEIPRFAGTCSEAGYLGPILAMPLYFFLDNYKQYKVWMYICLILLAVTVSTFNFAIIAITFGCVLYKKNRRNFTRLVFVAVFAVIALLVVNFFFLQETIIGTIINSNLDKALGYLTFGAYGELDWSASDRTEHLAAAFNMFVSGDWLSILFGHGTGAYSFVAMHNTHLMVQTVEEAHNIYLSTLTDRGVIGLIVFVAIFYNVYKIKSKSPLSDAIWFSLAIQLFHYMIVGNMWLYYVWQEVIFLIGYEMYLKRYENQTQTH